MIREEQEDLAIVLVAAGSEVSLALQAAEKVEKPGLGVRVVSVPNRGSSSSRMKPIGAS